MTKKLLVGIMFRVVALLLVAFPFTSSLVVAALLNHFYGWEGRAFLIGVAGLIITIAMVIALTWFLDDCEAQVKTWLNSVGDEKPKPEAGTWRAEI